MQAKVRWPRTAGEGRRRGLHRRRTVASVLGVVVAAATLSVTGLGAAPAMAAPASGIAQAPPPGVTWEADSTPDLFAGFERTDYNEQGGAPEIANSPNINGRQALRFTVDPGGGRSEMVPKIPEQREGQVLYFGYNGYLAQNYPIDADKYQIIMQWHHEGDSGSPPLAVHARDNKLILAGGDNYDHQAYEQTLAPATANMPVNLVFKITFSQDPDKGSVDAWSQGRQVLAGFHPPDGTMYDDGDYLKVGMYRDTSLPGTARVFVNNVAVGTSYDAVSAAVGSSLGGGEQTANGQDQSSPATSSPSNTSEDGGLPVGTIATVALILLAIAVGAVAVLRRRQDRSGRR